MTLIHHPRSPFALAVVLAASLLAACSQQGEQAASIDPTVDASATTSATPEPTMAATDAFVAYLTDGRFTATADVSGTLALNGEPFEIAGEWTVSGANFHTALDFGGQSLEQAVVDGQNYVRQLPKPWARDPGASIPPDRDFASVLATLSWRPADEEASGARDTQLVATGSRIEAAMTLLGLVDDSVAVDDATLTVRIDRRGVPTEIGIEGDGHRLAGDPLLFEWDLVYALHEVGRLTTVEKPEVWLAHESELRYSMHHPESWSVTSEPAAGELLPYDLYLSPIAGEVHVTLFDGIDPGLPANGWLQDSAAIFTESLGPPEETEPLTVAGAPALFLATHGSDETGEWWFMQVSIVGTGRAWDIYSWAEPGTESTARETLDLFLATFEMADS